MKLRACLVTASKIRVACRCELAKEWHASLTYRYLHRTATSGGALLCDPITGLPTTNIGPASSNSLMVTVANTQIIKPLDN